MEKTHESHVVHKNAWRAVRVIVSERNINLFRVAHSKTTGTGVDSCSV